MHFERQIRNLNPCGKRLVRYQFIFKRSLQFRINKNKTYRRMIDQANKMREVFATLALYVFMLCLYSKGKKIVCFN